MKVALIGPTHPFRGGISHYTTLLYRAMKARHDTAFYAFERQYPDWLFPGKTDKDPSEDGLSEPGARKVLDGYNPLSFARLGLTLRKDPPDLLIIPWWVVFWAPHLMALYSTFRAKQTFFLVHNVHEHEDHVLKQIITRLVLRRGDRFLVHSRVDEERLLNLLPASSVVRVFHPTYEALGAEGRDLDGDETRRSEARRAIASAQGVELDDDTPLVLFFGFVRPYKGLPDLVEAIPHIRPDARIMVVGEFWKDTRAEFDAQVAALGVADRIICVDGYIPNEAVPQYFDAADLVALPYRHGTGSGILQMAFGYRRPVVATRVGSLPDAVRDERTGILIPPHRPDEVARAVNRYFELAPTVPFRDYIDADVRQRFSWDALVDRIEFMARPGLDAGHRHSRRAEP